MSTEKRRPPSRCLPIADDSESTSERGLRVIELAGLEPATSWVQSRRSGAALWQKVRPQHSELHARANTTIEQSCVATPF
jgi:hypothetical protein